MSNFKRAAILAFSILAFSATSFADRVQLRLENDTLFRHKDNNYTHGTGLEYCFQEEWYFKLQQNMYTPSDLSRTDHIKGDRPYCGWLGAELGKELFRDPTSPWTHYLGVNFGMIGPSSQAGRTQRWIHKVLDCREPRGWDNQLHDEFCVNLCWWTKYNWFITDWLALVPRAGVLVGTLQDAAELGCDLKLGYNLKKDVGNNMMFSATRDKGSFWDNTSFYVFVGPAGRYYLYNHILEGSLFNDRDDDLKVDILPFVGELQFGVGIEVYNFFLRYYATVRTNEFRNQPSRADYGGLVLGFSW